MSYEARDGVQSPESSVGKGKGVCKRTLIDVGIHKGHSYRYRSRCRYRHWCRNRVGVQRVVA